MVEGPVVVVELVSLKYLIGIIMIPGGGALLSILWLLRIIRSETLACGSSVQTIGICPTRWRTMVSQCPSAAR